MNIRYALAGSFLAATMAFSTVGHAVPTQITFDTIDYQLYALTNIDLVNEQFSFVNNTGETWTDFHLYSGPDNGYWNEHYGVIGGQATTGIAGYIQTTTGGYDGTTYDGPGTYALSNLVSPALGLDVDITGISISDGSSLDFTIDYDVVEGNGGLWWLSGIPTTNTALPPPPPPPPHGDPEPATIALMGVGLLGFFATRRRRNR